MAFDTIHIVLTAIRAILLVALTAAPVFASEATKMHERDYQVPWCEAKGRLLDGVEHNAFPEVQVG